MRSEACEAFLKIADQFKLGSLDTEKTQPLTENLSEEAKTDLPLAIKSLKASGHGSSFPARRLLADNSQTW